MPKIILTNEVSGLGSAGDVVEVKGGYARNYLIPNGYAVAWSKGGERQVDQIKAARKARHLADAEAAQTMKARLEEAPIKISMKSGKEGRLFGAVKHGDVANAISAAGLGEVDKRKVEFATSIKTLGQHEATVRIGELTANLKLQVVEAK
jgi:large subunit ribosomal protein L9